MTNVLLIKATNKNSALIRESTFTTSQEKYRTDCAKSILGKDLTVQFIRMNREGTLWMGCDEDGLYKQLPLNFFMESVKPFAPQPVVGDVVFVRTKPCNPHVEELYDYEVTDIQDQDKLLITKLLDDVYQYKLFHAWKNA